MEAMLDLDDWVEKSCLRTVLDVKIIIPSKRVMERIVLLWMDYVRKGLFDSLVLSCYSMLEKISCLKNCNDFSLDRTYL